MIDIEIFEEKKVNKKSSLVKVDNISKSYYDNENIKYFSKAEYMSLFNHANKFYKLVYLMFFETAGRVEEIRSLKFSDVDFDLNKIKIRTSKQRSKRTYRVLPISDSLKAVVLQHKMEKGLENIDYILSKKSGNKAIIRQAFDKMIKVHCDKLGIERNKAHFHSWRHTRAINLLENGVDIVKVQKFLGHSSIQNTLIYLKYSDKDFDNAIIGVNRSLGLI